MLKPLIHLNGTSRERLAEAYGDAVDALRMAIRAAEGAAPNGRDYYPIGEAATWRAQSEHAHRMERLQSVLAEFIELRDHCAEAE